MWLYLPRIYTNTWLPKVATNVKRGSNGIQGFSVSIITSYSHFSLSRRTADRRTTETIKKQRRAVDPNPQKRHVLEGVY
jgi:hypothetical protein